MRSQTHNSDAGTFLVGFGQARFMRYPDGRVELEGGDETERRAALEWLRRFLPNVRLGPMAPIRQAPARAMSVWC